MFYIIESNFGIDIEGYKYLGRGSSCIDGKHGTLDYKNSYNN